MTKKPETNKDSTRTRIRHYSHLLLIDAVLCVSRWTWTTTRGPEEGTRWDLVVYISLYSFHSRGACHAWGLFPVVEGLSMWHMMPNGHTSSWLHIGCVKNCRKSEKMAKVGCALPCSTDTSTLGLSYCWTKPFQTNGEGEILIVHSRCFGILLLTDRGTQRSLCLKCVCMVNHSKPPALVSFTYFISQVCEPLHSKTNFPVKPFSTDDLHKLWDMRTFLSLCFFFWYIHTVCTHIPPMLYHFSMSHLMNFRPHQVIAVSNHKPP